MRRTPLLFVTVAGLLLLSGCFKVDADFKVNADETVDGTMIVAIDKEFQEMLGSMGDGSTEDEDLITLDDMPEGTEVEDYDQGGFVGQKVTFEGVTFEEIMSSADEDAEVTDEWTLTHEGNELVFEGTFDMTSQDEAMDMTAFMKDADISISMEFPGDISESNGEIDGNTVTWTPEIGDANEMRAVAADEPGFPLGLVIGAILGVSLLIGLGVFLVLSRRKSAASSPNGVRGQEGEPGDLTPRA